MLQCFVRLSVVCNVRIVAKRLVLSKNCLKKPIGNGLWGIEWSRDRRRHVTLKGEGHDPNMLKAQYLENSWSCYLATIANYYR